MEQTEKTCHEDIVQLKNGYRLIQDKTLFRLGTDAILLSSFPNLPQMSDARLCDLCSGNGAVSVLLSATHPNLNTVSVEIQPRCADIARRNISLNNITHRATVVETDLREIMFHVKQFPQLKAGSFDVVTCNPPYRRVGTGKTAPVNEIEIARAEVMCTVEDVCRTAAFLLRWGGSFCCVHRPDRLCDLLVAMRDAGIEPKRLRMVQPRHNAPPSIVLVEGKRGGKSGLSIFPPLIIYDQNGVYTNEIADIYAI